MTEKTPSPHSKIPFLQRSKVLILKIGCQVFGTLLNVGNRAIKNANTLLYRTEKLDFPALPEALKGTKLLFLTDPHIGGNIDALATQISTELHVLLDDPHPEKTIILHGGDFVCSPGGGGGTTEANFLDVAPKLFRGLSKYPQFGVIGNHDHDNVHFETLRGHLENTHKIRLLETPEDTELVPIGGTHIAVHGIHTLSTFLHYQPKPVRDTLLDALIDVLNTSKTDFTIVLLHNPDGLEFLLQRLLETKKTLAYPTLFLAGHTHGGMFDLPVLRHIGLLVCRTQHGRYKGWYGPEGRYAQTGDWQLYVSTGMGNSKGLGYRINTHPEVVLFTL